MSNYISPTADVKKRPKLVWVITIYFFISAGFTLLSYASVYSGISICPVEADYDYFKSQTVIDISITILETGLYLLGAIFLFMLRRAAFILFSTAFITVIIEEISDIIFKNLLAHIGVLGLIGPLIGWSINIAIIIYSRNLIKRGILA